MNATSQVWKPFEPSGGDEFAFFALIRDTKDTPSNKQITQYHSLGGYLFRGVVHSGGQMEDTRGETLSVFLDCGGPDGEHITPPSLVAPSWNYPVQFDITLVHPSKWGALEITEEDITGAEQEIVSRICGFDLPYTRPGNSAFVGKDKFNVPFVSAYQGIGLRRFVPFMMIQKGLFGDQLGNFLLHFRMTMHVDFEEDDTHHFLDDRTGKQNDGGRDSVGNLFTEALELRSSITERIIEYDSKVLKLKNKIVLEVLKQEIKILSKIVSEVPELGDFV